jgi:hypothetical protein
MEPNNGPLTEILATEISRPPAGRRVEITVEREAVLAVYRPGGAAGSAASNRCSLCGQRLPTADQTQPDSTKPKTLQAAGSGPTSDDEVRR